MKTRVANLNRDDSCRAVLLRQSERQKTATAILSQLDPLTSWLPFGRPSLCGAMSYGLLVARDIDIEIFGEMDVRGGFSIVSAWAQKVSVRRASFINAVGQEDAGFGWDVQYAHDGEVWHIQMWLLPPDYLGPRSSDLVEPILLALDETSRCAILRIKESLIERRIGYRSIDVYRAVLDYGVNGPTDYETWNSTHASRGMLGWLPLGRCR